MNKEARITVYTATYNRGYVIHKCYEALCRQSCKEFIWLIVDDGSTDNTQEIIKRWIDESKIQIKYIYQNNAGVNAARNLAIERIDTPLNICVDSDDYLLDDSIETLLNTWDVDGSDNFCGVIGYDIFKDGKLAGDPFPPGLKASTLFELYEKYRCMGDKKMMYRTDLCKKYPCPIFPGEKYYPNRQKYYMIEKENPLILLRRPLCVVEYLPDGITASKYQRYYRNPRGLANYRLFLMRNNPSLLNMVRQMIHYIAMNLIDKKDIGIKRSPNKLMTLLLSPFGLFLYLYILFKNR